MAGEKVYVESQITMTVRAVSVLTLSEAAEGPITAQVYVSSPVMCRVFFTSLFDMEEGS